jgi:hypothetical protein
MEMQGAIVLETMKHLVELKQNVSCRHFIQTIVGS